MQGAPQGLVDGVPATVKDIMIARGWPTLRGSKTVRRDQPWDEDAPMVARLREHGAVLIGKTTTPGIRLEGDRRQPAHRHHPQPVEPGAHAGRQQRRRGGGGGAGMGPLHLGTDGGGSIRIPSSLHRRVRHQADLWPGAASSPPSPFAVVSHTGPMTRTVADAALMLSVIAGWDPRDPYALPPEKRDYRGGLDGGIKGLRCAYSRDARLRQGRRRGGAPGRGRRACAGSAGRPRGAR